MEKDQVKVLPDHFFRQKRTRSALKWSKQEDVGKACRPFIKPERPFERRKAGEPLLVLFFTNAFLTF